MLARQRRHVSRLLDNAAQFRHGGRVGLPRRQGQGLVGVSPATTCHGLPPSLF
jgi:hypothetical protein